VFVRGCVCLSLLVTVKPFELSLRYFKAPLANFTHRRCMCSLPDLWCWYG